MNLETFINILVAVVAIGFIIMGIIFIIPKRKIKKFNKQLKDYENTCDNIRNCTGASSYPKNNDGN